MKQEGDKPCQIISSQLNLRGHLKRNASNGNTNVQVNGREITQKERRMLQVV